VSAAPLILVHPVVGVVCRHLIGKLSAEEQKISYDRRILHGKLDILPTERRVRIESDSRAHVAVEQLASILSRKTTADQRS
jgi:hypothetical protein